MNVPVIQLNLLFAWLWILLGFVSGLVLGLFFHRENWLGGYGSFRRRMYRLAHISFFGLGAVNLFYWLTLHFEPTASPMAAAGSWAFMVGGLTMPTCCLMLAHFPKAHMIFAVPVLSLIAAGLLTLLLLTGQAGAARLDPGTNRLAQAQAQDVRSIKTP